MKFTTSALFLWLWAIFGLAQSGPSFLGSQTYPVTSGGNGGNNEEAADFILPTSDGGYLLVGSFEYGPTDWDGRVIKVNSTGTFVWEQKPGGFGYDYLRSAVEVSDGYVVAGEKEVNGKAEVWLIKYSFSGTLIWENDYANTNPNLSVSAYTITTTHSNNLLVGGATWGFSVPLPYPTPPNSVGRLWVFDQNGGVVNQGVSTSGYVVLKVEKGTDNSSYYAFGEQFDGNEEDCWSGGGDPNWVIYDAPYFPSSNGTYSINFSGYFSDIVVDKFSGASGSPLSLLWTQSFGGNTSDGFIDGIATPDGGFALLADTYCQSQFGWTGQDNIAANYPTDRYWLLKGNSTGSINWLKTVGFDYGTGHPKIPRGLTNTCDGNYVLCLDSYPFSVTGYVAVLEKHNSNDILWFSNTELSSAYSTYVARTSDNKFVVMSNRFNDNAVNYDFALYRWGADPNCSSACGGATPISCGTTVSGTTATGTNSFGTSNYTICGGFTTSNSFNAIDKVYSINKSSSTGDLVITLFSTNIDHDIFLFSQCNNTPAGCVGYSDKPVGANGINQEVIRVPNAPSGTYYIVVDGYNSSQQGAFTLTATCGNLSCSAATPISCGQTLNNQSNASASNNVSTYCGQSQPGQGSGCTGKERVYSISVTQQQPVTINLTGIDANENFELFLLSSCNKDACIASSTNGYGVQEQIAATLSPGTTYYIVVDGWRETQGNFNLSVNCCPTPTYSFNCGNLAFTQTGASNPLQYTFSSVGQNIATGYTWQVNNQNVTNATGNSFTYTFPSAGTYDVCLPVIGTNGCVEYCCRKYCIAPPVNCETSILYSFNGSQMVFNLQTGGQTSSASWVWDDNPGVEIGTGNQISVPIPPQCTTRTISVKYIDVATGCWRICCRTVYVCNPFTCYNFTYSYNGSNGFVFTIDPSLSGATNISWTVDDHPGGALNIGNAATSQPYPVPSPCVNRTITLRYFHNGVWYICCRTIQLCNPFNCGSITLNYTANQGYTFTLASASGYQNISWQVDQTGQSLGNNIATSQPLPVPAPGSCVLRTVSVRYFDPACNCWRICCLTFWLCNPNDCSTTITPSYGQNGSTTLQVSSSYQQVQWFNGTTAIGSTNPLTTTFQPGSSPTVYVRYYDPVSSCYYYCCRTLTIPPGCQLTANFTYTVAGSTATFTNTSTGSPAYTSSAWTFTSGSTTLTSTQTSPVQTLAPGTWNCCLTVSNSSCSSSQKCESVVVGGTPTTPPGWDFVPTGENHTIIVPSNIVSNINGQPLAAGDLIGCFYTHNSNQYCAGYGQWTGAGNIAFSVYGNDATAPNKNGFALGEIFKVKVWRTAQQITVDVQATYTAPNGNPVTHTDTYAHDGISQIQSINGSAVININLTTGWNIISSYITPSSPNMVDVFASIQDKVVQVKDAAGGTYIPSLNINTIGNWSIVKGYQVKVTSPVTLTISGQKVDPAATPITLLPNWQTIAYLRDNESPAPTQFGSIASSIVQVKNSQGQSYIPSININTIGNLKPTQGYKLKASASATLVYTANLVPGETTEDRNILQALRFFDIEELNTGENATIIIPVSALNGVMEVGDEIGIFSQDDILCGAASYLGDNFAIAIWGDDKTTTGKKEGLTQDELFYAKIIKANRMGTYKFQLELENGLRPVYSEDEIFTLKQLIQSNAGDNRQPAINIQPNPVSDWLKVVIHDANSSDLLLTLHSQDGLWRKEIYKGEVNGDVMEHEFFVSYIPSGLYFCTARFHDKVLTYRIVVQH